MILKINRIEFLKKIKVVEKAISENKIRPIISYMYLETKGNKMWLCGTNLELTISTYVDCKIMEGGKAVFQHILVEEYLKEIVDEEITLNIEEDVLIIETSDSSSEFILMNADEFPKIQEQELEDEEYEFDIEKIKLSNYFEKVKFAALTSSDNLAINCIRLEIEDKKIKFISTDTYRLIYLEEEYEKNGNLKVSIPLTTTEALIKLFKIDIDENIKFVQKNKKLYFKIGEVSIASRIIELPFPNYEPILNISEYNKKIEISKINFEKMLKRIQIFVKNNYESKFGAIFDFLDNQIVITGIGEIAKAKEELNIDYKGDKLKISLNVKFLLEFIQINDKEKITLELNSPNSAVRLRSVDDENYTYIVMPLALKD